MNRQANKRGNSLCCDWLVIEPVRSSNTSLSALVSSMAVDVWRGRSLAGHLFLRAVNEKYRFSLLGYASAIIPMAATSAIWILLRRYNAVSFGSYLQGPSYAGFVLTGMMLWQSFTESVQMPLRTFLSNRQLASKIPFPLEALLLAAIGEIVLNTFLRLLILFPVLFVIGDLNHGVHFGFLVGLAGSITAGLSIGITLVPFGILMPNDSLKHLTTICLLWLCVTPVLYPPPGIWLEDALLRWINPISILVCSSRDSLLVGVSQHAASAGVVGILSVPALALSLLVFRRGTRVALQRSIV